MRLLLIPGLSLLPISALAQQTLFNVPSADVTPPGQIYLEHESQFRPFDPGSYWYGGHYFAYGLKGNTEADVTLYGLSSPPSNNITLGAGFKSSFALLPQYAKEAFHLTVGAQGLFSLQGQGVGDWIYGHLSGKIPGAGTRITAGIDGGTRQLFGTNTVGFIGGVEEPVSGNVTLMTDWFSGQQSMGFWTTGFSIATSKTTTLDFGYQTPNARSNAGRPGFTFEIAEVF